MKRRGFMQTVGAMLIALFIPKAKATNPTALCQVEGSPKYKVWDCKIVVPIDAEHPSRFDGPPRHAAVKAVEAYGIKVIACFSGWDGKLDESELELIEK